MTDHKLEPFIKRIWIKKVGYLSSNL